MARVVEKVPCPKCREKGGDSRGDNLLVYDDGGYHCFACGYHRGAKFYNPVKQQEDYHHDSTVLPADFTREVPGAAWKWLLQYGLPISYWRPYVGYSERDSRLVFTVGDPVCFSIGRDTSGESKSKWFVWGDSHKTAHSLGCPDTGRKVVFVEDIVSAHKVGGTAIAVPLFGTVAHPCHLKLARYFGLPIVLWLDKDQDPYVRKKATQISLYTGLPVEIVSTPKDPKELSLEYIKEQLA